LQAALVCFAAHGPNGARVDEISAAAGVNKRMLYHHFGDKAGLYQAVLAERVLGSLETPGDPDATGWLADVSADQWRLLAWQASSVGQWSLEGLVHAVAARQQTGEFRQDISAEVMALCLLGAHALPKLLGPILQMGDTGFVAAQLASLLAPPRHAPRPRVRIKPSVVPRDSVD
jgi:AcrR family transcriptional regulator